MALRFLDKKIEIVIFICVVLAPPPGSYVVNYGFI